MNWYAHSDLAVSLSRWVKHICNFSMTHLYVYQGEDTVLFGKYSDMPRNREGEGGGGANAPPTLGEFNISPTGVHGKKRVENVYTKLFQTFTSRATDHP